MKTPKTGFVSEIDQFIEQYDQEHPELSKTQLKEKTKYQRITQLRDEPNRPDDTAHLDDWF